MIPQNKNKDQVLVNLVTTKENKHYPEGTTIKASERIAEVLIKKGYAKTGKGKAASE